MPNKKISQLNENLSPSGDNIMPIVASGTTDFISLSGLSNYIAGGFSGGKQIIGPHTTVEIKNGFQFLVYGDLVLSGGTINNYGDITIINGSFLNSGGTYFSSGGTMSQVNLSTDSTKTILLDVMASGATINLTPNTTKTIVKINTQLTGDTNFTCSDITKSKVGDILIVASQPVGVTFYFDSNFFISRCGSPYSSFSPSNHRNVIMFIFDGEVWMDTYDNC